MEKVEILHSFRFNKILVAAQIMNEAIIIGFLNVKTWDKTLYG